MDQVGGPPSSVGQVDPSASGTDDPSSLLWHCSLSLPVSPFSPPPLCLSVSFTLVAATFVSLCSGGWFCGCKSKQARGTTSHHAGGSTGKGSRQSGIGGWWRRVLGLCRGWRGGENGEEIVELLVVQPMKLGVGWQGSRKPALQGGFVVSECLSSHACVLLKMLWGGTKIWMQVLDYSMCDNTYACARTCASESTDNAFHWAVGTQFPFLYGKIRNLFGHKELLLQDTPMELFSVII